MPPGQWGGSWRRYRNSGGETVAAKAVAAAAAAATASARVNVVPWRCVDALSPRFPAGLLRSLRPACGSGKDLRTPRRAQRPPPCSKGSSWRPKSQFWGVGSPRAVCGESATTDRQRKAGREEPALLPSPSAASCSLPPAGAAAAVGSWPWSPRKATRRNRAGAPGRAELGAGPRAGGTQGSLRGLLLWSGAGRRGKNRPAWVGLVFRRRSRRKAGP